MSTVRILQGASAKLYSHSLADRTRIAACLQRGLPRGVVQDILYLSEGAVKKIEREQKTPPKALQKLPEFITSYRLSSWSEKPPEKWAGFLDAILEQNPACLSRIEQILGAKKYAAWTIEASEFAQFKVELDEWLGIVQ